MNAPPGPVTTEDVNRANEQMRNRNGLDAPVRESFLQRVRAARKRLSKAASPRGVSR
jgi:hypothetical protein